MSIVLVVLLVIWLAFSVLVFIALDIKNEKRENGHLHYIIIALLSPLFLMLILLFKFYLYLSDVRKEGGFIKYYKKKRESKKAYWLRKEKDERITDDYLNGKIQRHELPRKLNGIDCFEFNEEMGLKANEFDEVREIVYVESEYNDCLNKFFMSHKDLRLYHKYKFVYLPHLREELLDDNLLLHYLFPSYDGSELNEFKMDSTYPLQFLSYKDDSVNIRCGMFFFLGDRKNHGAKFIEGHYYPLEEGDDDTIIKQLDKVVKSVHSDYPTGGLYSTIGKPDIEEGSTDEYADRLFFWVNSNSEIAQLVEEVKERLNILEERGMPKNLLLKLFENKVKLSRLLITKDFKIILPDFDNIEIKMEPLVKAVYLLFLNHPDGIVFKYLPDYREELTNIYKKLRPLGLNNRSMQSLEDVTNPCLNSINEKCARIRAAFISQFDDHLAKYYYIDGVRGNVKKISLPRDLVVWE